MPADGRSPDGRPLRVLTAAVLSSAFPFFPVFLMGALAVPIRTELGFDAALLGLAASAFFGTATLGSVHAGRLAERVGPLPAMTASSLGGAVVLVGAALTARSWWSLVVWLVLAGIINALAQPAATLALARGVSPSRQGTAYGVRTGSVPAATLLAGLAVPTLGLTLGWRWTFAATALLIAVYGAVAWRLAGHFIRPAQPARARGPLPVSVLALLAVVVGIGIGLQHAVSAFYVSSAVALGHPAGIAGIWLAVGALSAVMGRVLFGRVGDTRGSAPGVIALLMLLGAAGVAALGVAHGPVVLGVSTVLAYGAGSGWNGLSVLMTVRAAPHAPASASGVVMVGGFGGGVVGPFGFGLLVERFGYDLAWPLAAAPVVLAAGLVVLAGVRLRQRQRQTT